MANTNTNGAARKNPLYREVEFWATRRPIGQLIDQQAKLCRLCIEVGSLNAAYLSARRAAHLSGLGGRS